MDIHKIHQCLHPSTPHQRQQSNSLNYGQKVRSHAPSGNKLPAQLRLCHPGVKKHRTQLKERLYKLQYQQLHISNRTKGRWGQQVIWWLKTPTTAGVKVHRPFAIICITLVLDWNGTKCGLQFLLTCPYCNNVFGANDISISAQGQPFIASFSNSGKKNFPTFQALPHFPLLWLLREYFPQLNADPERLQHIISRWTKQGQFRLGYYKADTHGIHSEAEELNTGVVSRR